MGWKMAQFSMIFQPRDSILRAMGWNLFENFTVVPSWKPSNRKIGRNPRPTQKRSRLVLKQLLFHIHFTIRQDASLGNLSICLWHSTSCVLLPTNRAATSIRQELPSSVRFFGILYTESVLQSRRVTFCAVLPLYK